MFITEQMNNEQLNYQLIARYLADKCSKEEEQIIKEWARKANNKEKLEQFKRIWDAAENKAQNDGISVHTRDEWNRLQERFASEGTETSATKVRSVNDTFRSTSLHSMTQRVVRVAAIFLLAGLISVVAYQNWYQPEPAGPAKPVLREISTEKAQRANLTLSDGTHVLLNAGSTVKVPSRFDTELREVYMQGEAYFEVVSNPEKPFVIYSRNSRIEVLGTSFSVRSYDEDGQVRVVVKEGQVSLTSADANNSEEATLAANEVGWYQLDTNTISTAEVEDMQLYMSWRDGYLKFKNEPMENVAKDFERRYGVEVSFDDPEIKQLSLTAYLKSRSLQNVLDVIATSLDIRYELNDNKIIFMK